MSPPVELPSLARPGGCAAKSSAARLEELVASGGQSEVTVYGTSEGVRSDPQIGKRLDSASIDETPILGRKLTTLPLFNSAFRQGKGTGDLFVNATYFVTASGSRMCVTTERQSPSGLSAKQATLRGPTSPRTSSAARFRSRSKAIRPAWSRLPAVAPPSRLP